MEATTRNISVVVFTLLHAVALLAIPREWYQFAIAAALFVARFHFFQHARWHKNPCCLALWITAEIQFMASLPLRMHSAGLDTPKAESAAFAMGVGEAFLLLLWMTSSLFASKFWDKRRIPQQLWTRMSPNRWVTAVIVSWTFIAFCSLVSYSFGITQMGRTVTQLPFKLTGILNTIRMYWAPIWAIVVIDILYEKRQLRFLRGFSVFLSLWLAFECFIRGSRGFALVGLEGILIWSVIRGVLSGRIVRWGIVAVLIMIISTPIITSIRYARMSNRAAEIEVRDMIDSSKFQESAEFGIHRRFGGGAGILMDYYEHLHGSLWHDNTRRVLKLGGTARYHTVVIDGFSRKAVASSGTSLFADGYLVRGILGMSVVMIGICAVGVAVDSGAFGLATYTPCGLVVWLALATGILEGGIDTLVFGNWVFAWGALIGRILIVVVSYHYWGRKFVKPV